MQQVYLDINLLVVQIRKYLLSASRTCIWNFCDEEALIIIADVSGCVYNNSNIRLNGFKLSLTSLFKSTMIFIGGGRVFLFDFSINKISSSYNNCTLHLHLHKYHHVHNSKASQFIVFHLFVLFFQDLPFSLWRSPFLPFLDPNNNKV